MRLMEEGADAPDIWSSSSVAATQDCSPFRSPGSTCMPPKIVSIRQKKRRKDKKQGLRKRRASLSCTPDSCAVLTAAPVATNSSRTSTRELVRIDDSLDKGRMLSVMEQCDFWSIWQEENDENKVLQPKDVVVALEATDVCCQASSPTQVDDVSALKYPHTICGNFVGVVSECGPVAKVYGITQGIRVASIFKWRSTSSHVAIPPKKLIAVPQNLDAADIVCIISAYLPAFQALHHGKSRQQRYRRHCLKGQRILITGGVTVLSQALIRLAYLAGATEIYLTAPREHHACILHKRAVILDDEPNHWLAKVRTRMDVVIDYDFPQNFSSTRQAVARKGRLVCVPQDKMSVLNGFFEQCELSTIKRASLFDREEAFASNRDVVWEDMKFLLKLLSMRRIRPDIDRFVSKKDLLTTQIEATKTPRTGTIICEPWKE